MSIEEKKKTTKRKFQSDNDEQQWSSMSREQLIERCQKFEKHVEQLRNSLTKNIAAESKSKKSKSTPRPFDFNKYGKRHIFLKFLYLGWEYHGLVVQENTSQTVEDYLFDALLKTRLIENRATSNYHRCGRTDRGVSAFSQVVSLTVRSKATSECNDELNYVQMLNGVLPSSIRCTAWAAVPDGKSARFDCVSRSYRYYFPKANLDLNRMRQASSHLVGTHDFRNFCKLDITNSEPTFIRRIDEIQINVVSNDSESGYQIYELLVVGSGFLWHQIRCLVAILILIGQRKEEIDLIQSLLDIKKFPSTPNYRIASELPLVLFDCQYDGIDWISDKDSLRATIFHLQKHWSSFEIRATMIRAMLNQLVGSASDSFQGQLGLIDNEWNQSRNYQPILMRSVRDSVETKLEKLQNKNSQSIESDSV